MDLAFRELENKDKDELITFISSGYWPYHSSPKISTEKLEQNLADGYFNGTGKRTFLIYSGKELAGVMRLFDLGEGIEDNETPLFDIKIAERFRGKGIGKSAVKWLCDIVFNTYPKKNRFEATTRIDNIAMRKVLESCGFIKEGHYRQAWPDINGDIYDCAGYAILRNDWKTGSISPVEFEK